LAAGIALFVSVRFSDPLPAALNQALDRLITKEGGCRLTDIQEDVDGIARFLSPSSAFLFVRALHNWLRREKSEILATVGIAAGETDELGNSPAIVRSVELATFGHPGQTLVDPAAREIGRIGLPAGFIMPLLGETRLAFSLSAEKIYQLTITGLPDDFPPLDVVEEVYGNVKEFPKKFIGREKESAELESLLVQNQVVSIVGPGGVGKTALAHWLSDTLSSHYRDGSWRIDLAKLPKGGNVAMAIAADLQLRGLQDQTATERVVRDLQSFEGLLWVDNCEHVIDQCREVVSAILLKCTRVKFLLTSRTALELVEEKAVFLSPLDIPKNAEEAESCAAVQLFIDRAKVANPAFDPLPSEYELVIEVCRKVDGLPLAIELAAAQISTQPVGEVLERLGTALKTPQPNVHPRHRTLNNALTWSYSLLDDKEQKFFRQLGVLIGPINRDMIVALGKEARWKAGDSERILGKLVRHSLVQEDARRGQETYRLLEPVRQFAYDHLERAGELAATKRKFAKVNLVWLQGLSNYNWPMQRWLANVRRQWPNLEVALKYFLADPHSGRDALTMSVELYDHWIRFGPYDLAHEYYGRALAAGKSTPARCQGDIYAWMGTFAMYAGRYEESEAAFVKAIELHRKSSNRQREQIAWQNYTILLRNWNRTQEALEVAKRCAEQSLPTDEGYINLQHNYSWMLQQTGNYQEAKRILQETLTLSQQMEYSVEMAWRLACQYAQMYSIALAENSSNNAEQYLSKSLEYYRESANLQGLLAMIEDAGFFALRMGDYVRAGKLIAGAAVHFEKAGVGRNLPDAAKRDEALAAITEALGNDAAELVYITGGLLSLDDLYDLARAGNAH